MNIQKRRADLGMLLALTMLVVFSALLTYRQQSKQEDLAKEINQQVQKAIEENLSKPSNFPDYDSLGRLKKLNLVSNFESWTPLSQLRSDKLKKIVVLEKGILSKGYLYIRASLDDKALTQWESIYVTMDSVGGHLFRPQSLSVPSSQKTELLYALNDIPYLFDIPYNERAVPARTNWFNLYGEGSQVQILSFISSLRPALIEELTIYYECAKDSDCVLAIQ